MPPPDRRARLTVLYTGMVLAAGIVLTALTYVLMHRALGRRLAVVIVGKGAVRGPLPPLPEDFERVGEQLRQTTLSEFVVQAAIALAVVTVLGAVERVQFAGRLAALFRFS